MSAHQQWTIGEVLRWTGRFFAERGIDNARLDAEILLAHVLHSDRLQLYVNFHKPLQQQELSAYRSLIKKRVQRIPVAYLTGGKEFMGLFFLVNESVLIPRPDTEIVVEALLSRVEDDLALVIVDVGSGSGAIIISLLRNLPAARGIAIDISKDALAVTAQNAISLGVADRLRLDCGDMLAPVLTEQVDIVVSNPPYIPTEEIMELAAEVRQEPVRALDGGRDGLKYYRLLIVQSRHILKPGGWLAFEVGIAQASQVEDLMRETGMFEQLERVKDYGGIERVVIGQKKRDGNANAFT